ncbi:hypothetical protein [Microbacterium sp. ZXX196]|uniref:hypothetical protein n=1 Tax=Microbacterium sp. ZXX196 TaxID=2609291 RepID=UPI0012B7CB8C|nr:hypothetical protein [Microbacterium sp. ZXX196]MTE24481.1 hypothetical protein [Microbacterium sp. ZXX196]
MSTDSRRALRRRRGRGRFAAAFVVVIAALAVIGGAGAAVGLSQGPRVTSVQADPSAAIGQSGSRVIFTANQSLSAIDPAQVSVEPAAEFTVDAVGRTVGVRFPAALDAATRYTITVSGVTGAGGGPAADLTTTFETPRAEVLTLKRDPGGDDVIASRAVGSDADPVAVFRAEQIDDFRATSRYLVASVVEEGETRVFVLDRADPGADPVPLELPGDGYVQALQLSEQDQLVGFTFTDGDVSAESGRVSVLFTGSLRDAAETSDAGLEPVEVGGEEPSIDTWRFVPETSSLLFNDFDGDLTLVDRTTDADPTTFGIALLIEGVARSTYTALVGLADGRLVELDLASGEQTGLDDVDLGLSGESLLSQIIPTADGGTLRAYAELVDGLPTDVHVVQVGADGAATDVATVAQGDALLGVCSSPSAQYAAVQVAPDVAENPYDDAPQPLPETVETWIYDAASGEEVDVLPGFDPSWCEVGPW